MTMDEWRHFFRGANANIFDVIDKAILIAASDFPDEFTAWKDKLAETFYTCLSVPRPAEAEEGGEKLKVGEVNNGCDDDIRDCPATVQDGIGIPNKFPGCHEEDVHMDDMPLLEDDDGTLLKVHERTLLEIDEGTVLKVDEEKKKFTEGPVGDDNCSKIELVILLPEADNGRKEKGNYGEVDAAEASKTIDEVLKVKKVVLNRNNESEKALFESLQRLQALQISIETLQTTCIGKTVNDLKKHRSQQIQDLARSLVGGWKAVAKQYLKTMSVPETEKNLSCDKPSKPSRPSNLAMEQNSSGGCPPKTPNSQKCMPSVNDLGRRQATQLKSTVARQDQARTSKVAIAIEQNLGDGKSPMNLTRKYAPDLSGLGPERDSKSATQQKHSGGRQSQDGSSKKPSSAILDFDEGSVKVRLEVSKRKLREGYEQVQNAKKQRIIKVLELSDLPRHGGIRRRAA